jgi:hypothetical protein
LREVALRRHDEAISRIGTIKPEIASGEFFRHAVKTTALAMTAKKVKERNPT